MMPVVSGLNKSTSWLSCLSFQRALLTIVKSTDSVEPPAYRQQGYCYVAICIASCMLWNHGCFDCEQRLHDSRKKSSQMELCPAQSSLPEHISSDKLGQRC